MIVSMRLFSANGEETSAAPFDHDQVILGAIHHIRQRSIVAQSGGKKCREPVNPMPS
jgi:hypothetical protein